MRIYSLEKGTTRSVLLIHPIGLALKFPRMNIHRGLRVILRIFKYRSSYSRMKWHTQVKILGSVEFPTSLSWYLFRGIRANFNEAKFFILNLKNPLLVPTYFSLFGIINLQPIVSPLKDRPYSLWVRFSQLTDMPNEMYGTEGHAWDDNNFTEKKDRTIALFDYASSAQWPLIQKYGKRFSQVLLKPSIK